MPSQAVDLCAATQPSDVAEERHTWDVPGCLSRDEGFAAAVAARHALDVDLRLNAWPPELAQAVDDATTIGHPDREALRHAFQAAQRRAQSEFYASLPPCEAPAPPKRCRVQGRSPASPRFYAQRPQQSWQPPRELPEGEPPAKASGRPKRPPSDHGASLPLSRFTKR